MRALINVISVKYGGSFTDTYNILKGLAALGKTDEYYFFISKSAKDKLPVLPSNFHALTFPAAERSWPVHFIYGQLFLPVFVLLKRIDVMLSFNFASFLAPCPQIIRITQPVCFSAIVAKKMKILGFVYAFRMFVYRNLILLSVKKADKVIFISEALKDDIAGFTRMDLRPERYIVSYNGLDKGFVEAKQAAGGPGEVPADGTFKLLYPSFYYFHKNFPLLFEAMAELRKKGIDNVKLMLTIHPEDIPPRDREGILKTLEENGLSSHVIFTGSLPYEDMPWLYRLADAVVFPSFAEACPNPLPEAMVFGVPIVASDIPAHKELCREAAIYFDVHSAQDLVEKILLLSKDAGLRRQLAANGVKRAAMFSWQSHVNVIYGIMEELKR